VKGCHSAQDALGIYRFKSAFVVINARKTKNPRKAKQAPAVFHSLPPGHPRYTGLFDFARLNLNENKIVILLRGGLRVNSVSAK
jgi:hypothetical protein